jgi:hypothetical protein
MDINIIVLLMMASVIGLYTWRAFLHQDDPPPSALPWVPIDANKHRSFVSMTRDAGMFTERTRRVAIIGSVQCLPSRSFWQKGFTNGVVESSLTGICPAIFKPFVFADPCIPQPGARLDGEGAYDENTCVLDGNGGPGEILLDAGNAYTEL